MTFARMINTALFGCLTLAGCSSQPEISVTNQTDRSCHIQMALSYPSHKLFGGWHKFDAWVEPGETWSTKHATDDERGGFELERPNGPVLLRVRSGDVDCAWKQYFIETDERCVVALDGSGCDVRVATVNANNDPVPTRADSGQWVVD